MSSGGISTPAGNTTTTQTTQPWAGQQPYLVGSGNNAGGYGNAGAPGAASTPLVNLPGILPSAAALYENYAPSYYPGSTVAQINPMQNAGINAEYNFGATGGTSSLGAANNFETNLQNGAYLDPTQNPNWQSMSKTILGNVVPTLENQFTSGNRMNSPGAAYAVSQGATDALGSIAGQNYQNTLGLMNSGAGLAAPTINQSSLSNIGAMQDAGNQLYNQSQLNINDAVNRYNFNQMLPYNLLNAYSGAVNGNYGATSTLTQPYYTAGGSSSGLGGLGGALGGAALGTAIAPGVGTVAGGLLGALLGGSL